MRTESVRVPVLRPWRRRDDRPDRGQISNGERSAEQRDDERGAALVEFAIVGILLLTMSFGTFEMGLAWSDSQLVTQAARTGARSATQLGINTASDSFSVEAIEAALGDLQDDVTRIVIYEANAADGAMPPACASAAPPGIPGQCSIYDKTDFGTYGAWTNGSWAPTGRDNTSASADYVGVTVEVDRPFVTGFFSGRSLSISDTTVMRIEPKAGD